jgi:hypothetical protein
VSIKVGIILGKIDFIERRVGTITDSVDLIEKCLSWKFGFDEIGGRIG